MAELLAKKELYELEVKDMLKILTQEQAQEQFISAIVKAHYKWNIGKEIGKEELEETVNKILPKIKTMVEKIKEKVSKKAEEIEGELLSKINPVRTVLEVVNEIFKEGKKILMVKEETKIPEDTGDIRVLRYRIEKEANREIRYGTIIGTKGETTVRAKVDKDGTVIIYSKQGLEGIGEKEIEEMFIETNTSGIKDGMIKVGMVLAFASNEDIKGNAITQEVMRNRIEIARKNGIIKSDTQIKYDLRKNKKIKEKAKQEVIEFLLKKEFIKEEEREKIEETFKEVLEEGTNRSKDTGYKEKVTKILENLIKKGGCLEFKHSGDEKYYKALWRRKSS